MQILNIINSKDWVPSSFCLWTKQYFSLTESRRPSDLRRVLLLWTPASLDRRTQRSDISDIEGKQSLAWDADKSHPCSSVSTSELQPWIRLVSFYHKPIILRGRSSVWFWNWISLFWKLKVNPWPWKQVLLLHHQRGKRVRWFGCWLKITEPDRVSSSS